MDFLPKAWKNWIGRGGPIFWATPSKVYEKSYLLKINKWWNYGFDISVSFKFRKISVECSVHIYRRPWIGDELYSFCSNTYFWQLILFEFIPYLGVVSQICISDLPWKHQHTTRWRSFSRLCHRHYTYWIRAYLTNVFG